MPPSSQPDSGHPRKKIWRPTELPEIFAIDLRALAVFRILLGGWVLVDLYDRLPLFKFFYASQGFLDLEVSQAFAPPSMGFWSLYWLAGHPVWIGFLMGLSAISAIGLMLGIRARQAAFITLVLFWSLNVLNPLVTTAGHVLLRMFLFWMVFLPSGERWSMDAIGRKESETIRPANQLVSVATAALMIQFAAMYFFSGVAKWNEIWLSGDALGIALQLDLYVKPSGHWLAQFTTLTQVATWCTLLFELIGPLMLFMPWANRVWRLLFAFFFCGLHLGIWGTMSIGLFSGVAMTGWLLLMPSPWWRSGSSREQDPGGRFLEILKANPIQQAIVTVFLAYVIALNIANIAPQRSRTWFPGWLRMFGNVTMCAQEFKMFSKPSPESFWLELRIVEISGQHRETLVGPKRTEESILNPDPESIYNSMPSNHFRRLVHALVTARPETEQQRKFVVDIRKRFAESWANWIRVKTSGSAEPEVDALCELNCFRKTIAMTGGHETSQERWHRFRWPAHAAK